MASDLYNIFPAVNSDYEFPPEIRTALLLSSDVQAAIDGRADAKATDRVNAVSAVRQYQNYRWTNSDARNAQTNMRVYDRGLQVDTGVEYIFDGSSWNVNPGDGSIIAPFMANRQYQNYRWPNEGAKNAQLGMRQYDRGVQLDTGVEFQYNGTAWVAYISASTPTNDASRLTSGTLSNERLDYGVVNAFRGDRAVDAPVAGENVNGDWNKVLQPGVYRIYNGSTNTNSPPGAYLFGTLVVFGAGASIASRTQVYYSHNGGAWYRSAWNGNDFQGWRYLANNVDTDNLQTQINNRYTRAEMDGAFQARDNRLNALELSNTPSFTIATGWRLNRATFWRAGRVLMIDLSADRTGGSLNGNFTNVKIGDLPGGWGTAGYAALASGPGGPVGSYYIQGTGIYIAATGDTIANNDEATCGGCWIMS